MTHILAINGSPNKQRGETGRLLAAVIEGAQQAGATAEIVCASELDLRPCLGKMTCWYSTPGQCIHQDDMQALYPRLWAANILILATPVYAPLPAAMQTLLNRLMPLLTPQLTLRDGRTRARFRDDVAIERLALVATSGWWETDNLNVVLQIAREMAANANVPLAGAVLRPHADMMHNEDGYSPDGLAVLAAARQAGRELVEQGTIRPETTEAICRPLLPEGELRRLYNSWARRAERKH